MNSTQKLKGTVIREGIPEHRIKLDNFRGNTRNTDLVLMGEKGNRRISISIEAKADEYFDLLVSEKLNSVKSKPDSKIPERIDILCRSLFGKSPDDLPILSQFRYQLLNGIAGTLKELPRRMWLEVEDFSSFNLNNTKIWAVLDCSFRTEDGGVTIIDWKTGRNMSEDVSMQLSRYAMYAMEK